MYGGMDPHDREAVKAAFQTAPDISPVRILLATDAASEGHGPAKPLLPADPLRNPLEPQPAWSSATGASTATARRRSRSTSTTSSPRATRTGSGATSPKSVGDLEADLEFLMRVARKIETIREDLGKVGPVIAEQVEEAMLGRRIDAEHGAGREGRRAGAEDAEVRAGLGQADQGADGAVPRDAEGTAAVAGEHPEGRGGRPRTGRAAAPDPDEVTASGRTQADVPGLPATGLEGKLGGVQRGSDAPAHRQEVRPVVFDHASAKGKDDVVLVHLNHRLVQMSLRLLRAEVWNIGKAARG